MSTVINEEKQHKFDLIISEYVAFAVATRRFVLRDKSRAQNVTNKNAAQ